MKKFFSFSIYDQGLENLVYSVYDWIKSGDRLKWLACINPHSFVTTRVDNRFFNALNSSDWLIPDGVGITLASKFLSGSNLERVTGPDFFYKLNNLLNSEADYSVFFLGSSEETLEKIRKRFLYDYPNIKIAGVYSPPYKLIFDDIDIEKMIDAVNAANPDVLFIGMTAPKQENWIFDNHLKLDVKFAACIGAMFDFYAGSVKSAPYIIRRLGLEWLLRFVQEPRRLWRRTFISAPIFIGSVLIEKINSLQSKIK